MTHGNMTTLQLSERHLVVHRPQSGQNPLHHLEAAVANQLDPGDVPVRLAVNHQSRQDYACEVGILQGLQNRTAPESIFRFEPRALENTDQFNGVLVIPTGIGAEIGGHAGDAMPVAKLLASVCDTLITHPNVVNASDLIQMPANTLYVEGSVISRLMMGAAGIQRTRNNRLLVIVGPHQDDIFIHAAINSANAARTSYGMPEPTIVRMQDGPVMLSKYAPSGRATGRITELEPLLRVLDRFAGQYDAVALTSQIDVPPEYHAQYFELRGEMVNPWGGIEAMLTHTISALYNVPSAHSPMFENTEIANADPGIIDPRMAAEATSLSMVQCILRGLQTSPRIVTQPPARQHHSVLNAADVSCLVIPDGCIGLPTLAALQQGIPTIAVRENRNLMQNDLRLLPWAPGQLHVADNYLEAAGIMAAIRSGTDPSSVRRPLTPAPTHQSN
jgi:hypothetical protein